MSNKTKSTKESASSNFKKIEETLQQVEETLQQVESLEEMTVEEQIEAIYSCESLTFEEQSSMVEELMAKEEEIALTSATSEQKKAFFSGSNSLCLPIYLNSLNGKFTSAKHLRMLSLELKDSSGKLNPMNWASFHRTWNVALKTLVLNKKHNLSAKDGKTDRHIIVPYFADVNAYLSGTKGTTATKEIFLELFKPYLNENNVVAKDSLIKVMTLTSPCETTKVFNSGHYNKIIVAKESLGILKLWLKLKGWEEEEEENQL